MEIGAALRLAFQPHEAQLALRFLCKLCDADLSVQRAPYQCIYVTAQQAHLVADSDDIVVFHQLPVQDNGL